MKVESYVIVLVVRREEEEEIDMHLLVSRGCALLGSTLTVLLQYLMCLFTSS